MNWKKLMRRAYREGVADGLSGYTVKEREEREPVLVDNIIREEKEALRDMALGHALAQLVKFGVDGDDAQKMVETAEVVVADDGLSIEVAVRLNPPVSEVSVNIIAPKT